MCAFWTSGIDIQRRGAPVASLPEFDFLFPTTGEEVRFPTTGEEVRFSTTCEEVRFPTTGEEVRFSTTR